MLPVVGIKPGPLITSDSKSPFWASEARANEEIFKLLFNHHLIFGLNKKHLEWIEHGYLPSWEFGGG